MLVLKKQVKTIKFKGVKPKDMNVDEWEELDKLAKSTIMLSFDRSVYYNVNKMKTSYKLWQKLCGLFKQEECRFASLLAQAIGSPQDKGRHNHF